MPSVEMRRSTRIFVPKAKDGGLVKVLRSGRRLWGDPASETTHQRSVKSELENDCDWFPLKPLFPPSSFISNNLFEERVVDECKDDGGKLEPQNMDVDEEEKTLQKDNEIDKQLENVGRSDVRVIRNVYSRKRKRLSGVLDGDRDKRKFGLHFTRRKRRKGVESEVEKSKVCEKASSGDENCVLSIVVDASYPGCSIVSRFLGSVLRNLVNGVVSLTQISAFLVSVPIRTVFGSSGIQFLLNCQCMINKGVCRISGERQRIPLFTIDSTAIPLCFLDLHATLSMRAVRAFFSCWMSFRDENERSPDDNEPFQFIDGLRDQVLSIPVALNRDDRGMKIVVAGLEAGRVGSRIVQYRSGNLTRSSLKRRRRSLRNRRARNPSHFVMQKANGPPVFNNSVFKKNSLQLPTLRHTELRRSARKNHERNISVPKSRAGSVFNVPKPSSCSVINVPNANSSTADLNIDVDSNQCCYANVLVVETDKCYRVEGAEVSLDLSPSNEWVLAIRKDGMTRYCLKAQKEMRLNSFNRFTHDVVWTSENGWKLEFPDRNDWIVFKELYKECGERNTVPVSPVVKNIPVPGVTEVADFWDATGVFQRPESYIRVTSDELSRSLSRRTANYDMDSDDEEWRSGLHDANCLSEETFELMIDAFEKASYFSPNGINDENAAVSLCQDLASAEMIMSVYRHWTKRREQKRVPLLKVFELNEPRGAQPITKPVLRKRRSLKRATASQTLQRGRGKDSNMLQAMVVEQTILEEQQAVVRAQEARASAHKLLDVAIGKRQRAQLLMENADLAIYQATMAMRIADAASLSVDSQEAARYFLD